MKLQTRFGIVALFAALLLAAGCKSEGEEKYTPSESNARQALEAALTQWRDGQAKPAQFPFGKVKVEVAIQAWTDGLKLSSFEIVGEEEKAGGARVFSVKLKTPKGEQNAKYYLVGIDPLWIYGEPDFKKLSGS